MTERVHGICRSCAAMCPIVVDMEDGRPVNILGNKDNPVYHGYSCIKGREMASQIYGPDRLLMSQKRMPDGSFQDISSEQAMDEIAEKLRGIIERHGPRAVATYAGTFILTYPATQPVSTAWMKAIGSPMMFTSATIDQPGKPIATALHGMWNAGPHVFDDDADTWLLVGINPIVAKSGGVPNQNPAKRLKEAADRGMEVIVIDPRRTECARHAAHFLQPRPGEDPTVLAGMIRVIIEEDLADRAFIEQEVQGFDALREAVQPFTPEYVERRAGVPAADLVAAARAFGRARRGGTTAGTGPNMAPRGNLTEYLLLVMMSLCGRWMKEGELLPNPGVLGPKVEYRAQATPPWPAWGFGEQLRVRGFTDTAIGLPTSALADEILTPGEGQVKALISIGGNPLMAFPDQRKTLKALEELELFVCLDIQMVNNSCPWADYVLACRHSLESPALTLPNELLTFFGPGFGYGVPYAQYGPAIVEPPPESDLIEEWEFFHGIARRLGLELELDVHYSWTVTSGTPPKVKLDMDNKPSTDELYELLTEEARVPLDEVKKHPGGAVFDVGEVRAGPKEPGWEGRLQVGDAHMMAQLEEVAAEPFEHELLGEYPFRLISRRMPDVFNSTGRNNPKQRRRHDVNPAFMNPADIEALGLKAGDVVRIDSRYDYIMGVVEAEEGIRPGVISMSHCWGGVPGEDDGAVTELGGNTGRLSSVEHEYDPITGIPRMSAIPVRVIPAAAARAS